MHRRSLLTGIAAFAAVTAVQRYAHAQSKDIIVFAAASLKDALNEVGEGFRRTGKRVTASYAASPTLAQEIAAGARADVFISANPGLDGLPGAA
jgi:molybdate transport system substrate-binding protein